MKAQPLHLTAQCGVALITVMLVVALATTAAVAMASRQQLDIRRTENMLYHGQALMYAQGLEQWVQQILYRDRQDNETDHLDEAWALQLPSLPVKGGQLSGQVHDLQGRYNLNNLSQDGDAGKREAQRFKRLLRSLEIDENLSDRVQDWLDNNQQVRFPEGAEDVYYLGLERAYRSADRMMQSPSELLLLDALTNEEYEKLLPHVCTLPQVTPTNINTASATVLMTLADDLPLGELEELVKLRQARPYDSVESFLSDKLFAGKKIPLDGLSVSSNFFLLQGEASIGHMRQTINTILERDDKGKTAIVMHAEGQL